MILIIDNYDSFTYNLARYFEELQQSVCVVRNDELTIKQLGSYSFTHLVLSPGPCTPNESGICLEAISSFTGRVPILGVCLGHQAIAQVNGAKIVRAKHVLHGKTSMVYRRSKDSRLFDGCPDRFKVTRYHSLLIEESSLSKEFMISAITKTDETREIMAIENHKKGLYGVQFHPESLLTEHGHKILRNFILKG